MAQRYFGSDNFAGVHPNILQSILAINKDHESSYGYDKYTDMALKVFKDIFGHESETYFVFNGTAANVLCIKAAANTFNSIICGNTSHMNTDECGAVENFTGCKLLPINTKEGKLTLQNIKPLFLERGDEHQSQPKVISITQSTELGTVYTKDEMIELIEFAHYKNMFVHIDGARLVNAAASLNMTLKEITADIGVDLLSFGGTKNGLMYGDAVIVFNSELAKNIKYIRKQGMQLASKMRFISQQFITYFKNELWLNNAVHSNSMAKLLAERMSRIDYIQITKPVQANAVFAIFPEKVLFKLQEKFHFYTWDKAKNEARLMTSYDTTKEDINDFINELLILK